MQIPRFSIPALASFPLPTFSGGISLTDSLLPDLAKSKPSAKLGVAEHYPSPQCSKWVGAEVIFMVEVTTVCPEGSTVTETITECVETLTRPICATLTTNRPCYPCIMGTPPLPGDTATVTMTSCSTAADPTVTITVQLCSTCPATVYTGTLPGYTPGGPCHGCSPYATSGAASSTACSDIGPGSTTTVPTGESGTASCEESGGSSRTAAPGDSGLPSSSTTGSGTTTPGTAGSTETATKTAHQPPTSSPTVVTGGGARQMVASSVIGVASLVLIMVILF